MKQTLFHALLLALAGAAGAIADSGIVPSPWNGLLIALYTVAIGYLRPPVGARKPSDAPTE